MPAATLRKVGGSLMVAVPPALATLLDLSEGCKVGLNVEDGRLIIEPVRVVDYSLDQLLAGISAANLHEEVDSGLPVGRELL